MKSSVKVFIHFLSWFAGVWLMYSTMSYSDSRQAYGIIVGWWASLYVGYVINIKLKSSILVLVAYILICVISYLSGYTWFYRGAPSNFDFQFFTVIVIQGCFFASPIIINEAIRRLYSFVGRTKKTWLT